MRQLEPVAAYVPYQVVVGNHEQKYNFTHYINRYTMPNTRDNLFYRFSEHIFPCRKRSVIRKIMHS